MSYSRTQTQEKRRPRRRRHTRYLVLLNTFFVSLIAVAIMVWYFTDVKVSTRNASDPSPSHAVATPEGSAYPAASPSPPDGSAANPMPKEQPDSNTPPPADNSAEETDTITLALVGDILPASSVARLMEKHGYDYPYRESRHILQLADIAAGNLETSITDRGAPEENKEYVYRGPAQALPAIRDAGFDVLSLANNHTLDYGWIGLEDTMNALDDNGLLHMGTGDNETEAYAPVYVEAKGFKVAFIGVSHVVWKTYWNATKDRPGMAETYDPTRTVAAIAEAKQHADLVVVMVHWGTEYTDQPEPYQVKKGRQFIDAGADLVIGSHPHVLQGFEAYKGRWIAYSLGNFVFSGTKSPQSAETGVLTASCRKNGQCKLQFHPMLAQAAQPAPMEEEAARALLARIAAVSTAVKIEENGNIVEQN